MRTHTSWPLRDEPVALCTPLRRSRENSRGLTLIELLAVAGAMAVVLGVAMPHYSRDVFALWNAQTDLIGNFRRARMDALTKGDHFKIQITSDTTYAEYRLKLVGATWTVSGGPVRTFTLPGHVRFSTGVNANFEFMTRGLMVLPGAALTLTLQDTQTSHTRNVTVWPSGQVAPI